VDPQDLRVGEAALERLAHGVGIGAARACERQRLGDRENGAADDDLAMKRGSIWKPSRVTTSRT
jgi:hypothetical protein